MESEIAKLLNINAKDSDDLGELVTEFFAADWEDAGELLCAEYIGDSLDSEDEFDPNLTSLESAMQNNAVEEYSDCTADNFDEIESEKASKFR